MSESNTAVLTCVYQLSQDVNPGEVREMTLVKSLEKVKSDRLPCLLSYSANPCIHMVIVHLSSQSVSQFYSLPNIQIQDMSKSKGPT